MVIICFEKLEGISLSLYRSETTYETPPISNPPDSLRVPTEAATAPASTSAAVAESSAVSPAVSAAVSPEAAVSVELVWVPPILKVVLDPEQAEDETMIDAVPPAVALKLISPSVPENTIALLSAVYPDAVQDSNDKRLAVYLTVTVPDAEAVILTVTVSPTAGAELLTEIDVVPWAKAHIARDKYNTRAINPVDKCLNNLFILAPFKNLNILYIDTLIIGKPQNIVNNSCKAKKSK